MFKKYLNSTLALSQASSSGSIVESYFYDAYGNRFLFQGREYDYTTQLYNFRARWYDPETGRWLSNDPIGISGGLNLYAFCANDPVNYVDPMGLDLWIVREDGLLGHEYVVGENGDGTCWHSDFMPDGKGLGRLSCPGTINFDPDTDEFTDMNNLKEGLRVVRHVVCNSTVDKKVKKEVEKRYKKQGLHYDFAGYNCRNYTGEVCDYAVGVKLSQILKKRKK